MSERLLDDFVERLNDSDSEPRSLSDSDSGEDKQDVLDEMYTEFVTVTIEWMYVTGDEALWTAFIAAMERRWGHYTTEELVAMREYVREIRQRDPDLYPFEPYLQEDAAFIDIFLTRWLEEYRDYDGGDSL